MSGGSDYPLRRQLAAEGLSVKEAAARLGISPPALGMWARRNGVKFRDGRCRADAAPKPPPAPLSWLWLAARLTESERADYRLLRGKGGQTGLQALAAIRRPDLVAEVTAHFQQESAAR